MDDRIRDQFADSDLRVHTDLPAERLSGLFIPRQLVGDVADQSFEAHRVAARTYLLLNRLRSALAFGHNDANRLASKRLEIG